MTSLLWNMIDISYLSLALGYVIRWFQISKPVLFYLVIIGIIVLMVSGPGDDDSIGQGSWFGFGNHDPCDDGAIYYRDDNDNLNLCITK